MNLSREFDIIVWGASGFTGRLVVLYLFNKFIIGIIQFLSIFIQILSIL